MYKCVSVTQVFLVFFCQQPKTTFRASGMSQKKKVKFCGIFMDKFAEKMADFARISREFARPVSLKNDWQRMPEFVGAS